MTWGRGLKINVYSNYSVQMRKKRHLKMMTRSPILVLNSAVNPLAYAFYKSDIKKESKRVYKVIFKKGNK